MYVVVVVARAKRSLKKYRRNGMLPVKKYDKAVDHLRAGRPLPSTYRDHSLRGDLTGYREFHLDYDLLVRYERDEQLLIVTIAQVGTHAELFGR